MLKEDDDLTRADLQDLSGRDALAAFFAKLGYATNARLVQNIAAMGMTGDSLKSSITHIERLASQDARLFEVYLFELKSVTVAAMQGIVRTFRNRPGDYLLVLTDDYQRLDFVLVERYSPEFTRSQDTSIPGLSTPKHAGVRPRVLTVNRRDPDSVALRVLRRFSYTESDTFAQYDKLLSAYDVVAWSAPFFNNRALFSDYYLTKRLPDSAEWKSHEEAAPMTRAFKELRKLYADVRETFSNQREELVRAKLLEPVLTTLGFAAQPVKTNQSGEVDPDYRLYAASGVPAPPQTNRLMVGAPLAGALGRLGTPAGLGVPAGVDALGSVGAPDAKPLALCLAYTWGRNLDGKDEQRDSQSPDENPGAAVVTLLDRGEADWAIVTNGKTWRLYAAKAHSRATNYYEIDLEETLALPPAHLEYAFRYFWLLFRAAAFISTERVISGEKRQMCFLDTLMSESERYARELGERLKERVFEEIFPHFARGFIIHARHSGQLPANLDSLGAEERNRLLEPFFGGTLTFLYRLLFLLYAESRDLLPVREVRGYYEKSLEQLKKQIAEQSGLIEDQAPAKIKAAHHDRSTALYDELQALFRAVDQGDAAINVPVYNGGLFITQPDPTDPSPEAAVARFLATHKIPDRELALGLDRMARDLDEKTHALAPIDYKSLGVRQLGSIYEGLLEFKLRIAPEAMAVVKGKKTEEIVSYAEAQRAKLPILKEGRGKDAYEKTYPIGAVYLENDRRERKATGSYYTPDYIVKYIVEHTVGPVLQEKLEALRPAFRAAEQTLRAERAKYEALKKQGRIGDPPENQAYLRHRTTVNEVFFDLKVLDPAMGSGHFLVEAVDYITDQVATFLTAFKWNPVVHELAKTRREIQEEMDRQGVTIDVSKLTDINLLKRQVLKRCIYGVDLNPMAVELAKVSLWLDCFTLGAPLSFLDHHMKTGNSLIGGNVQEVQDALSRDLFGHQFTDLLNATQLMRRVGELSDVTAQEVAESRKAYKGAYDALAPFKRLLDVWISEYFGNKKAQITTRVYAGAIVADNYSKTNTEDKKAIETALTLARDKRFFHWELEFPEVFYDETKRKENGGFDAVVGNPPYVSFGLRDVSKIEVDEKAFFEQLYKNSAEYKISMYALFMERSIQLARNRGYQSFVVPDSFLLGKFFSRVRTYILGEGVMRNLNLIRHGVWEGGDVGSTVVYILVRDNRNSILTECGIYTTLTKFQINDGEKGLISSAFFVNSLLKRFRLISSEQKRSIIERVELNGEKLGTYVDFYSGLIGKKGQESVQVAHITASKGYGKLIDSGSSLGRYSLQWNGMFAPLDAKLYKSGYSPHKYLAPKIFLNQTGDHFKSCYDPDGYFCLNNIHIGSSIRSDISLLFIVAILNSKLMDFYYKSTSLEEGRANAQTDIDVVETLPICRISFITSPDERSRLLEKAKALYERCMTKDDQLCVLGFVEHHLSKEPEESDVVHDLLAFLAEEMMRLNKEKRAAMKEFLDWLITTLKILPDKEGRKGIDTLTGKSKLADYAGDYQKGEPPLAFGELMDILQKNRARLAVRLGNGGLTDQVRVRYEESLGRVLPLKERLARTDRLIDQVVYRLYGLTEEEIRVVEGRG